jgi:hypothetical protein
MEKNKLNELFLWLNWFKHIYLYFLWA